MEFLTAIRALQNGHKVRRRTWPFDLTIATGEQGQIESLIDGQRLPELALWSPRLTDLTAADWEIYVPRPHGASESAQGQSAS
jgi:hypothetical protein